VEYQYKPAPQPSQEPDLVKLQRLAVDAVREAASAIENYKSQKNKFGGGSEWKTRSLDDELQKIADEKLLPLFLGAPGEVCDSCGGSGRK
jgi:hypothetical protein